jgi:N-acetylglucosaminyldiphosphoundecaprenol N-acetyl-beta-D-mannosaminyltransferase
MALKNVGVLLSRKRPTGFPFLHRVVLFGLISSDSPPFKALSEQEDADLVEMINSLQPDLWVGLGAPKQEKWNATHLARVNVPVQVGVGAAFDFHSTHVKSSPVWMQKTG